MLATYNGERYLKQQLDSILQQTYPHLEVIAVDDCSSDSTVDVLREYARKDRRLRVAVNETNLGYVKNFEKGLRLASGGFIAPSDQDDVWHLNKIETLLHEIGDHEIVYANSLLIDSQGSSLHKKLSDIKHLLSFDDCLTYAIGNTAPGHGMLIRRSLLARCYPFPTMIPHDYWLGFVATCKMPIKFVDTVLVEYRQHTHNVFGAVKVAEGSRKKTKPDRQERLRQIRERMRLLYEKCPEHLQPQKAVYQALHESYQNFSFANNVKRMMLFFRHRDKILAFKNRSALRKWLFCCKMFFKIK